MRADAREHGLGACRSPLRQAGCTRMLAEASWMHADARERRAGGMRMFAVAARVRANARGGGHDAREGNQMHASACGGKQDADGGSRWRAGCLQALAEASGAHAVAHRGNQDAERLRRE